MVNSLKTQERSSLLADVAEWYYIDGLKQSEIASRIVNAVPDDADFALLRRSWTAPILALTDRPQRFSNLKSGLITISDRALSLIARNGEGSMRDALSTLDQVIAFCGEAAIG